MFLKKLARLANKLDELGHKHEASEVDNILKHVLAFWEKQAAKCACDCEECKNGNHKKCTVGKCECKKVSE